MASLRELAELVGAEVVGNPDVEVTCVMGIEEATPGAITFVSNVKYLSKLQTTQASAVIVPPGVTTSGASLLVCRNPYLAFAKVLTRLHTTPRQAVGVMEGAWVHPSAELGEGVSVYPGCFVGENSRIGSGTVLHPGVVVYENVVIGADCQIHARAVIRENCLLGDRVILQPGAVVGSDGFGFAPDGPGYYKIPQVGRVVLEDDVEIGSSTCVDRATLGETRICRGVKLDNLVQIAHNVVVGESTVMAAQSGVSGSTRVGRNCVFGGQAATAGHVKIGDRVTLGARSGVTNDTDSNQVLSGFPAIAHKDWLRAAVLVSKLPEIKKEIARLKAQLEALENTTKGE